MMSVDLEKMNIRKKDNAMIGDIAAIFVIDGAGLQMMFYAKIHDITPNQKNGWWNVNIIALLPVILHFTWTLREPQFNGEEFTLQGIPHTIIPIDISEFKEFLPKQDDTKKPQTKAEKSKRKGGLTLVK